MADANVGLLSEAAAALMKPSFLPQAKDRCERVRKRFFRYEEGKRQRDIKQEYILDGNNIAGRRKWRRVLKGWRVPHLGRDGEVAKIKEWIQECLKYKALNVSSVENAYEVLRGFYIHRKRHHSETYYVGYPPTGEGANIAQHADTRSQPQNDEEELASTEVEKELQPSAAIQDIVSNAVPLCARELFESAPAQGDMVYFSHIKRILLAARNDRLFFFLCKISEDVSECKIDCVAAALLDVCKTDSLQCDILVTDALHYRSAMRPRDKTEFVIQQLFIDRNIVCKQTKPS